MQNKSDPHLQSGARFATMPPVVVGRENEARRLTEAILKGETRIIFGPSGIGKTVLVQKVIGELSPALSKRCLYVAAFKDLQDLLRQLIFMLYDLKDSNLRQQLHSGGITVLSFASWLKSLPSPNLRGTLYRTVEQGDYRIFIDHIPPLTHPVAKIIKELFWMRNAPVYLLFHDEVFQNLYRFHHFFHLGDRERLTLQPLPSEAASELLELSIERFGLSHLDLSAFREEVLELSKQVPGAIVKMCALAADPRYQYGSQVKVRSVYIDYLMSGHGIHMQDSLKGRAL